MFRTRSAARTVISCIAVALLLATSACTSGVEGSAGSGTSASASSTTNLFGRGPGSSASSGSPSSKNPSSRSASSGSSSSGSASTDTASTDTLSAAGIDPCKILPDDAQTTLGITSSAPSEAAAFDGASCVYKAADNVQYALTVTDGQTLAQLKATVSGPDNTDSQIQGFPALTTYDERKATICTTAIGVSKTGMFVTSVLDPKATAADKDTLCSKATDAATTGLQGLRAQQ